MELRHFDTTDEIFTTHFGKEPDYQPGALFYEQVNDDIIFSKNGEGPKIVYPGGYLPYFNPKDITSTTGKVFNNVLSGFNLKRITKSKEVQLRILFGSGFEGEKVNDVKFYVAFKPSEIKYVLLTVQGRLEADEQHKLVTASEIVYHSSENTPSGVQPVIRFIMSLAHLTAFRKNLPFEQKEVVKLESDGQAWIKSEFDYYLDNLTWTTWHDTGIKFGGDTPSLYRHYSAITNSEQKTFRPFCFDDELTYCMGFVITPYGALVREKSTSSTVPQIFADCDATVNTIKVWEDWSKDDLIMMVESFYGGDNQPRVKIWFETPEKITSAQKNRVAMLEGDFIARTNNLMGAYGDNGFSATVMRKGDWIRELEKRDGVARKSSFRL